MPETNSFLSAAFSLRSCSSSAFKSSFDMAHNQSRKKKRRLAKQTVASLSAQGPDLDCSQLAVMNANNDPLGVRSACPFPVADAEGRPFGFRQFAPTGFRLSVAVGVSTLTFRESRGDGGSVQKSLLPWQT